MKILFYGINFSPELTGVGKYSGEMINFLVSRGHEAKVVTVPPYYPEWKISGGYNSWEYKTERLSDKFVIYRCPIYVPNKPSTPSRLIHLISFAVFSFPVMLRQILWNPDLVLFIEPSLFCAPCALATAKLARAKAVLHIQDYEIDAMFGLGFMKDSLLSKVAKTVEKFIMRSCDCVSTISFSMINLAIEKGMAKNKVLFFPNWVDTNFVSPAADKQRFRRQWKVNEADKVILYSGNLGKKQGLEIVLEAAYYFREISTIHFFIIGEGAHKESLVRLVKDKQLPNVHFRPLQSYEDLPDLLAMADIHLVVQRKGAADIVLPSKLSGIFSAGGHALITAEPNTELGLLARKFPGIAHFVQPESLPEFISGLEFLLACDTSQPNSIARKYAIDVLEHDAVLNRFEQELKTLVQE